MRRFLRFLTTALYALLAALFAAAYTARYLRPGLLWWTELLAVGLPYLSLLLLAATLFILLARRWRLLLVHAVILILIVVRFVPFERFVRQAEAGTDSFTVMTFNIPDYGSRQPDERTDDLLALVEREQPDLMGFQESGLIFRRRTPERGASFLLKLIESRGYQSPGPRANRGVTHTSQPVLTRFVPEERTEMIFWINPDDKTGTRVVRTVFTWQGRQAVHYNLHLRTFGEHQPWRRNDNDLGLLNPRVWIPYMGQYREAFRVRDWEVEQILRLLQQETLPLIVSGDFNSTAHNRAFYRLAERMNLQDAFKVAGQDWGATYHARAPFARIDFVLAGPEWEVVSAHVPDVLLSDHRPLVVKLRWR